MGAGLHRAALHGRSGRWRHGSSQPRQHDPDRSEVGSPDGNLSYEARPQWFKNWETTGLLKFEDKNGDGRIQYYNEKIGRLCNAKAEGFGWKGNELTVNHDILVLANPEIARLPNWVIALVAAGGLAAALSTAAGLLLAISSVDVARPDQGRLINPNISEKGELLAARISMAVSPSRLPATSASTHQASRPRSWPSPSVSRRRRSSRR